VLLPVAACQFDGDERVALIHDDTDTVGALLVTVAQVTARAQELTAPETGPGISLVSLDGLRGLALDREDSQGLRGWSLLWWREPDAEQVGRES
jgi:hypothetical protein